MQKKTGQQKLFRPYIPILVSNPHTGFLYPEKINALLDTGADSSVIPGHITKALRDDLTGQDVEQTITSGVNNKKFKSYLHTFQIYILSPDQQKIIYTSKKTKFNCIKYTPPVLLGYQDFLKYFKITFDYPKNFFSIEI
ncbi:MAG: hypothetical protein U9O87_06360 [Verrucomicrobiota bacterium]|nr:hypothetical protein [Verrucomicrobiota bacterium]